MWTWSESHLAITNIATGATVAIIAEAEGSEEFAMCSYVPDSEENVVLASGTADDCRAALARLVREMKDRGERVIDLAPRPLCPDAQDGPVSLDDVLLADGSACLQIDADEGPVETLPF